MKNFQCVVVTGLSGAGKTEAIRAFEDMGYFCIDNFPAIIVDRLEDIASQNPSDNLRIALVIDARGEDFFGDGLSAKFESLKKSGFIDNIIFIEASDESLIRRYKESRRPHPLSSAGGNITEALARERKLLSGLRDSATHIIDTTNLTPKELRFKIGELFAEDSKDSPVKVNMVSFGYKHGIPLDADIVFDVRFLPNPYYNPEMRNLTGENIEVRKYVLGQRVTSEFLRKIFDFLKYLMSQYEAEGRDNITIAIGCTGGKHRSVVIAQRIAEFLRDLGYKAYVSHRDIGIKDKISELEY